MEPAAVPRHRRVMGHKNVPAYETLARRFLVTLQKASRKASNHAYPVSPRPLKYRSARKGDTKDVPAYENSVRRFPVSRHGLDRHPPSLGFDLPRAPRNVGLGACPAK